MEAIIDYLVKNFGVKIDEKQQKIVEDAHSWWRGKTAFHSTEINNGEKIIKRQRYSMKMAKKVCEDWASLLMNEKTMISCDDEYTKKWLIGDDPNKLGGFLKSIDFWNDINSFIEETYATGTGALILRVNGIGENGEVTNDSTIECEYINAMNIFPIRTKRKKIVDCVFVSEENGTVYIESHIEKDGKYVIKNEMLEYKDGMLVKKELAEGVIDSIESDVKLFHILKPNIVNNVGNDGRGLPIPTYAIDQLKGCDLAYDNFLSDIELGKKMIFMRKDIMGKDKNGNLITPQAGNQQLMMYVGDDMKMSENPYISEFNPSLRVNENVEAIKSALNYLSFKAMFGIKHYSFENGQVVTATQYVGDKQDLVQNVNKQYISIESFVHGFIKSVLQIRKTVDSSIKEDTQIDIVFDDSFFNDTETQKLNDQTLVAAGIMNKWEYRVKWLGETEEEAKANVPSQLMYDIEGFQEEPVNDDVTGDNTSQEKITTLNGAQTQSLISVVEKYSDGSITIGVAINIISKAIGVSKEEAKALIEGVI